MNIKQLFFIVLAGSFTGINAQQNTTASGGDASGTGGSASYSIGQIDYTAQSGANGSVNQGVQQPYEILVTTGLSQKNITIEATVFPNPTSDFLTLSIKSEKIASFSADIFDAAGKLLLTQKITALQTQLDLKSFSNGIYFVSVKNESGPVKQFKIIKNK